MIRLGAHLRELARARAVIVVAVATAAIAALGPIAHVSVAPPRLQLGSPSVGASTQILVDNGSGILSTASGVTSYDTLQNGALLVGNVMTTAPGDAAIARAAHVPRTEIRFADPQVQTSGARGPVAADPRYTLTVSASPSVPLVDVYATGPNRADAVRLANAAYAGVADFLLTDRGVAGLHLSLTQLGHARSLHPTHPSPVGPVVRFLVVFVVVAELGLRVLRAWRRRAATARLRTSTAPPGPLLG